MEKYKFKLTDGIGEGTFGTIYSAINTETGEDVAIKIYGIETDKTISISTMREIGMYKELDNAHPNIVKVIEYLPYKKTYALIMKKYDGDLYDYLKKDNFNTQEKIYLMYKLIHTLSYLHNFNIMHRDIKNSNILIEEPDGDIEPVFTDFGTAKFINFEGETQMTHTQDISTRTYRAPEVVNKKRYGLIADEWSLGVICLEIIMDMRLNVKSDSKALKFMDIYVRKCCEEYPEFTELIQGFLNKSPNKRLKASEALELDIFKDHSRIEEFKYEEKFIPRYKWLDDEAIKNKSKRGTEEYDWKLDLFLTKMFGEKFYHVDEFISDIRGVNKNSRKAMEEYIKYEKKAFEELDMNMYKLLEKI